MRTGPSNAERLRREREQKKRRSDFLALLARAENDLRTRRAKRNRAWVAHSKRLAWVTAGAQSLTASATARQSEMDQVRRHEPDRYRALLDISPAPTENVQRMVADWLTYADAPGVEGVGVLTADGRPREMRTDDERAREAAALRQMCPVLAGSSCVLIGLLKEQTI